MITCRISSRRPGSAHGRDGSDRKLPPMLLRLPLASGPRNWIRLAEFVLRSPSSNAAKGLRYPGSAVPVTMLLSSGGASLAAALSVAAAAAAAAEAAAAAAEDWALA